MGAVKASPQSQLRLLELADLDAELARLDHRRRNMPEAAELGRLEARAGELKDALVVTETELGDLAREQSRAERDVDQVRTRIDRDRARLDAGQVSAARELASLQSEIESLRRRQGDLEEIVLELMERREGLVSRQDELSAERDRLGIETAEVTARRERGQHHQDPDQQRVLVIGAERRDGKVFDRGRREIDGSLADRVRRRALRNGKAGHELGHAHRDRRGEQPGQGPGERARMPWLVAGDGGRFCHGGTRR